MGFSGLVSVVGMVFFCFVERLLDKCIELWFFIRLG